MTENLTEAQTSNGTRLRNLLIALAAIALSVAIFIGLQSEEVSLEAQAQQSVPLDVALSNQKPTLTEFYADWCTSCQAMASDLAALKQQYAERVNFTMLNVDNSRWLPEVLRYRVDGIPHFIFFSRQGEAIAETIGEQPRAVLEADLEALIASQPLPYTYAGRVSKFKASAVPPESQDDPRSHGNQVQKNS